MAKTRGKSVNRTERVGPTAFACRRVREADVADDHEEHDEHQQMEQQDESQPTDDFVVDGGSEDTSVLTSYADHVARSLSLGLHYYKSSFLSHETYDGCAKPP